MTNHSIVIADQDVLAANRAAFLLRSVGYTVAATYNSDDAIRVSGAIRPALLIINPVMRGLSGFEAAKRIVAVANCKLLFLTELAGDVDFEELRSSLLIDGVRSAALPSTVSSAELIKFIGVELGPAIVITDSGVKSGVRSSPIPEEQAVATEAGEQKAPSTGPPIAQSACNAEPYEELFSIAGSAIYQTNAFRLVGVLTTATPREVKRAESEFKRNKEIGRVSEPIWCVPHIVSPSEEEREIAFTQFDDPERRLLHEFFWFWPDGSHDEAFDGIRTKDSSIPLMAWQQRVKLGDPNGIANHNLAVLNHLMALQIEGSQIPGRPTIASDNWKEAFQCWQAVLSNSKFWDRFIERIREYDDPRVSPEVATKIWGSLPEALLYINASNAVRNAEAGSFAEAARQRKLMYDSGLGVENAERALNRALEPMLQDLRLLCSQAEAKVEASPVRGLEIVQELDRAKSPILKTLNCLVGAEDRRRNSAHDQAVISMRSCLIDYVNATKAWSLALPFFENCLALVQDASLRGKLTEDIAIVRRNLDPPNKEPTSGATSTQTGRPASAGRSGNSNTVSSRTHGSNSRRVGVAAGNTWKSLPLLGKLMLVLACFVLLIALVAISQDGGSNSAGKPLTGDVPTATAPSIQSTPNAAPVLDASPASASNEEVLSKPSDRGGTSPLVSDGQSDELRAEIDRSKSRLDQMITESHGIQSEIEDYETSMDSDKSTLDRMQADSEAGIDIDRDEYERIRGRFNQNVQAHNADIDRHKEIVDAYETLLAETNDKVHKYNELVNAQ